MITPIKDKFYNLYYNNYADGPYIRKVGKFTGEIEKIKDEIWYEFEIAPDKKYFYRAENVESEKI